MFEKALKKLLNPIKKPIVPLDNVGVGYDSEVIDTIIHTDGSRETINHGHNAMVSDNFLPCLALSLAGKAKLKYWAIGEGDVSWDGEPAIFTIDILSTFSEAGTLVITAGTKTYDVSIATTDSITDIQDKIRVALNVDYNTQSIYSDDTYSVSCDARVVGYISGVTFEFNGTTVSDTILDVPFLQNGTDPVDTPIPARVLVSEVGKKIIASSSSFPNDGFYFLDGNGERTETPTNKLEIQVTFGANDGLVSIGGGKFRNTAWREFSIVGATIPQEGETEALYYINIKRHAVINKTVDEDGVGNMIVERKIRFTFNGATPNN